MQYNKEKTGKREGNHYLHKPAAFSPRKHISRQKGINKNSAKSDEYFRSYFWHPKWRHPDNEYYERKINSPYLSIRIPSINKSGQPDVYTGPTRSYLCRAYAAFITA